MSIFPVVLLRMRTRSLHLLVLPCALLTAGPAAAATCFVTPSGGGNGSSWVQAANLQSALSNSACTEVWVKKGAYTPGIARSDSFRIRPGVKVYGGFAGNETALGQRNPITNLTILSGDIGSVGDASDNSYHVVYMDGTTNAGNITASTVLDGFTVSDGYASSEIARGAGLYCDGRGEGHSCSPSIANVVFDGNNAGAVGGIPNGGGGAMYNDGYGGGISSPNLNHVTFTNNHATYQGGAMFNNASTKGTSSPSLSFVTFSGNSTPGDGGAMYNFALGSNSPGASKSISNPTLSNVMFSGNSAGLNGGAMVNKGSGLNGLCIAHVSNVTFDDNHGGNGGAVYNFSNNNDNSPIFSNVTFSGNTAYDGGAMYNLGGGGVSSPVLSNVTFNNNSARHQGGAIYNYQLAGATAVTPILHNVIAWGDSAASGGAEIYNTANATATVNDSVLQGGCVPGSGVICSNVNIVDPLLGTLQNNGGFTQTQLPDGGGSAVDAGNDSICAAAPVNGLDQRGVARPQGVHCDIGAVEVAIDLIFRNGFESH